MYDSSVEFEIAKHYIEERNGYLKEQHPDAIDKAIDIYKKLIKSENFDKNKNYYWIIGQDLIHALDDYLLPDENIGAKFLGYWFTVSYAEDEEEILELVEE